MRKLILIFIGIIFILFLSCISDLPDAPSGISPDDFPAAPTNLVADTVSHNSVHMRWDDNSNNEDGFRIERRPGVGGNWGEIVSLAANEQRYSDINLTASTTLLYRVRAFKGSEYSPFSNTVSATTSTPPTTGTISGTVTDADGGAALPDALVELKGSSKDGVDTTDAEGKYKFEDIEADTVILAVSLANYISPMDRMVIVKAEETVVVDFALERPSDFIFQDNFDNDPLNQPPDDPAWEVMEYGSSTCRVSGTRSYPSGGRSVKFRDPDEGEDNGVIMFCVHEPITEGTLSFWIYFPSRGNIGIMGFDDLFEDRTFGIQFNEDGMVTGANGDSLYHYIWSPYPINEWIHIEISYRMESSTYDVRINGELVADSYRFFCDNMFYSSPVFVIVTFTNATLEMAYVDKIELSGEEARTGWIYSNVRTQYDSKYKEHRSMIPYLKKKVK